MAGPEPEARTAVAQRMTAEIQMPGFLVKNWAH